VLSESLSGPRDDDGALLLRIAPIPSAVLSI